jgi:hypothetical protein
VALFEGTEERSQGNSENGHENSNVGKVPKNSHLSVLISLNWNHSPGVHHNRLLHIQRLVPPKEVDKSIESRKCERNQLKLCDSKSLYTPRDEMNNKPRRLEKGDGF